MVERTIHVRVNGPAICVKIVTLVTTTLDPLQAGEQRGDLRLILPGAMRVRGKVVDEEGKPLTGIACYASNKSRIIIGARTD